MREMSVEDRLYFIKRGLKCYNVHIVMYKGDVWEKNILFRDYMIIKIQLNYLLVHNKIIRKCYYHENIICIRFRWYFIKK